MKKERSNEIWQTNGGVLTDINPAQLDVSLFQLTNFVLSNLILQGYNSLPPYAVAQHGAFNYPPYNPQSGAPPPHHPPQQPPPPSQYPTTLPNFSAMKGMYGGNPPPPPHNAPSMYSSTTQQLEHEISGLIRSAHTRSQHSSGASDATQMYTSAASGPGGANAPGGLSNSAYHQVWSTMEIGFVKFIHNSM